MSYGTCINACAGSSWRHSLQLLMQLQARKLWPNAVICAAAVKACGTGSCWQGAMHLVRDMEGRKVRSNMAPWVGPPSLPGAQVVRNALIHACVTQWVWALWLLGPERDVVSYGAALHAMVRGAAWRLGLALYAEMGARMVRRSSAALLGRLKR